MFVTAYDDRAVDAFELQAADYLMKPVRADRLAEAVRRVVARRVAGTAAAEADDDETIAVELAGVTRFVRRSQVRFVEAQGDYARLHTGTESHLLRATLAELESAGPTPGSCGSTAARWSRSPTSTRSARSTGGAPCGSARTSCR